MAKNINPLKKDQNEKVKRKKVTSADYLEQINFHAAGIDVGSKSHYVAVRNPLGRLA